MPTLTASVGGLELYPHFVIVETTLPAETDVTTLGNNLYTDFIQGGVRRSWEINFPELCKTDYDALFAVWQNQYVTSTYVQFVCAVESIDTLAKLNLDKKNIIWNGDLIQDFTITLQEQSGNF